MKRCALLLLGLTLANAAVADQTTTTSTPFEKCLAKIEALATKIGTAPVNLVETSVLRMVRFAAEDGSLLVTCSKPDSKMIVEQKVCGRDVEC
jgi:hypothetical protein